MKVNETTTDGRAVKIKNTKVMKSHQKQNTADTRILKQKLQMLCKQHLWREKLSEHFSQWPFIVNHPLIQLVVFAPLNEKDPCLSSTPNNTVQILYWCQGRKDCCNDKGTQYYWFVKQCFHLPFKWKNKYSWAKCCLLEELCIRQYLCWKLTDDISSDWWN